MKLYLVLSVTCLSLLHEIHSPACLSLCVDMNTDNFILLSCYCLSYLSLGITFFKNSIDTQRPIHNVKIEPPNV